CITSEKKIRGDGLKEVQQHVEVYVKQDDVYKIVSLKNLTEADSWIEQLVGLSANEFERIVLIPQGEFQKFLESGSSEKYRLLCKLFPVSEYEKITERFRLRANSIRAELKGIQDELSALEDYFDPALYEEKKDSIQNRIIDNRIRERELSQRSRELYAALEEAKGLRTLFARSMEIRARLENLLSQKNETEQKRTALARSQKLVEAQTLYSEYLSYGDTLRGLEDTVRKHREELVSAEERLSALQSTIRDYLAEEESVQGRRIRLHELKKSLPLVQKRKTLEAELRDIQQKHDSLKGTHTSLVQEIDAVHNAIILIDKQLEKLPELRITQKKVSDQHEKNRVMRDIWLKKRDLLDEIHRLKVDEESKTAAYGKVKKEHDIYKTSLDSLLARRNESRLANLALDLRDGEPCPLCGSTEHPSPADAHTEPFTEDELLETAQANTERTHHELLRLEENLSLTRTRIQMIQDKADVFEADPTALDAYERSGEEKRRMDEEIASLEQKEEERFSLDRTLRKLSADEQDTRGKLHDISILLSQIGRDLEHVSAELGNTADPEKEIGVLEKEIETFDEGLRKARDDVQAADMLRNRLHTTIQHEQKNIEQTNNSAQNLFIRIEKQCNSAGFSGIDDAKEYFLDDASRLRLKETVDTYDREVLSAEKELDAVRMQIGESSEPDEKKLQEEYGFVQESIQNLTLEWETLNTEATILNENSSRYMRLSSQLIETGRDSALIQSIAEELTGKNSRNIDFQTFVTASYLEKVLLYANERLRKLSGGQYLFQRRPDRESGNTRSGLQLDILDVFNGVIRDVNSLSGGEKFLASLSLALGLSDVVMAESGGVKIESLFIDEGFGSLDEEALERAIEILEQVREDRIIGIISHVKWLKERIPERIDVVKRSKSSVVLQRDMSHKVDVIQKES
ncbi:MAG: SbcC/MukB-like Walker B domain-containing protein, partial [Spirochaetota bacterium]